MKIPQMHIWFRQYAQQMGMQNVRAILPEQIDLMINTSISDIVNELIQTNVGLTNDRIVTNNSKIGQINALRTLYRVKVKEYTNKAIYSQVETNEVTTNESVDSGYVKAEIKSIANKVFDINNEDSVVSHYLIFKYKKKIL